MAINMARILKCETNYNFQRIALELQKKEKLRLQKKREERELRQAEKARAELSGASSCKYYHLINKFKNDDNSNHTMHFVVLSFFFFLKINVSNIILIW